MRTPSAEHTEQWDLIPYRIPFQWLCAGGGGTAIKKQFADQIRSFKGHTSKKMTILADMMDFVNEKVGPLSPATPDHST